MLIPSLVTPEGSAHRYIRSLRTEWLVWLEMGYPPRSLKLGIPATSINGGDGSTLWSVICWDVSILSWYIVYWPFISGLVFADLSSNLLREPRFRYNRIFQVPPSLADLSRPLSTHHRTASVSTQLGQHHFKVEALQVQVRNRKKATRPNNRGYDLELIAPLISSPPPLSANIDKMPQFPQPGAHSRDNAAESAERTAQIRIKNRRKMYLDRHPSYFTSPNLELSGAYILLYPQKAD